MTAPAALTTLATSPTKLVPARLSKLDQTWAPSARRQAQLATTARRYLEHIPNFSAHAAWS